MIRATAARAAFVESAHALTVQIADLPVTFELGGCDPATRTRLRERYDAFIVPLQPAALAVRVRVEAGPAYIPLGSTTTWQVRTTGRNGRTEFESFHEKGWADRATRRGELVMRPQGDPENFLRVLYAWLCLEQGGLLLHASGVIARDRGYVFCGPSGSGKTTVSGLSLDRVVLSDDLVIIRKRGEAYRLYGVPFRGELAGTPQHNTSAALRAVFTLVKDTYHHVASLNQSEATARLVACAPFVTCQAASAQRVTKICSDLATQITVRELHFRRDPGFWEVIDGFE